MDRSLRADCCFSQKAPRFSFAASTCCHCRNPPASERGSVYTFNRVVQGGLMKRFGLLIFVAPLIAAWGEDWTQWRGPSRDGQFAFTEPKSWPEKLNTKWKVTESNPRPKPQIGRAHV